MRVKLKSFEELEKSELIYRMTPYGVMVQDRKGNYKMMDERYWREGAEILVTNSDAIITKEEYETFKQLFEVISEED